MTNLWEETIRKLELYNLSWDDVIHVCCNDFIIAKDNFEQIARKTDYDSGYGCAEVATDLKIIGNGWWLDRREYDGSEWWAFNTFPDVSNLDIREIHCLANELCGDCGLKTMNFPQK